MYYKFLIYNNTKIEIKSTDANFIAYYDNNFLPEYQFADLDNKSLSIEYDSIIITAKNIPDSTPTQYMPFYKDFKIPFFL